MMLPVVKAGSSGFMPEHVAQRLGKIDFAALKIGVVDRVIDRLHRERVALFDRGPDRPCWTSY